MEGLNKYANLEALACSYITGIYTLTDDGEEWRLVHSVLTWQHGREVGAQHQQADCGAHEVEKGSGHSVETVGEGEDRERVAL